MPLVGPQNARTPGRTCPRCCNPQSAYGPAAASPSLPPALCDGVRRMAAPCCPARPQILPGTLTLRSISRSAPGPASALRGRVVMWPGSWTAPAWRELGRDGDAGLGDGQPCSSRSGPKVRAQWAGAKVRAPAGKERGCLGIWRLSWQKTASLGAAGRQVRCGAR